MDVRTEPVTLHGKRATEDFKRCVMALEDELDYWKRTAANARDCYEHRVSKFVDLKLAYDKLIELAGEMLEDVPQGKRDGYGTRLAEIRDISSPLDEG